MTVICGRAWLDARAQGRIRTCRIRFFYAFAARNYNVTIFPPPRHHFPIEMHSNAFPSGSLSPRTVLSCGDASHTYSERAGGKRVGPLRGPWKCSRREILLLQERSVPNVPSPSPFIPPAGQRFLFQCSSAKRRTQINGSRHARRGTLKVKAVPDVTEDFFPFGSNRFYWSGAISAARWLLVFPASQIRLSTFCTRLFAILFQSILQNLFLFLC